MRFENEGSATRIIGVIVTIGGLIAAFFMGRMVGQGNFLMPALIIGMLLSLVFVLNLGQYYWLLIPLGFCFEIPAIPLGARDFGLWEVCVMGVGALFLARLCMKHEHLHLFRLENAGIILYCVWVIVVYANNPAGLLTMGATMGGLRFYANIGMAAFAFFILSSKSIDEKIAKILLWTIFIGAFVTTGYQVLAVSMNVADPSKIGGDADFYSWHQALSRLPIVLGAFLFARFGPREIFGFSRPFALISWGILALICLYSGKRAALLVFLIYPFLIAILKRSERGPSIFYGLFMVCMLALLVMGNRQFYELPLGMQRALSILPGDWDPMVRTGGDSAGSDLFREKMRELAWERIERAPIIGKGTGLNLEDIQGMDVTAEYNIVALLAAGSAWHNTWLGIAADFGIPAVIAWLIFVLITLHTIFWVFRKTTPGSAMRLLVGVLGLLFFRFLLTSWTGGSAKEGPVEQWWIFGLLVAMKYSILTKEKTESAPPAENIATARGRPPRIA